MIYTRLASKIKHCIKIRLATFICFFFLLSLSSCFEIIDETTLNKDGSGAMSLTINLSKSKTKIASIMLMDSIRGYKVPQVKEIEKILDEAVDYLKKEKGISDVKKKADFENYVFTISCNFSSVQSMNTVINTFIEKQKNKPVALSYFYDADKNAFSRKYTFKPESKMQYHQLKEDDKKLFGEASYTSIFRFQDEVISFSNTNAKLSSSKKALMLKTSVLDLINDKANLSNHIYLKN